MQQKWFRARTYGWGWTPATWQGWIVLITYFLLIVDTFFSIDSHSGSVSDTLINLVPDVVLLTLILIGVCFLTGEKPHWSWGESNRTRETKRTNKKKSAKKKSSATRK